MALLSGRLPDATGVFSNDQSLSSDIPTLAHALTIAGYESVLCGRMHFVGPDQRHGYTRRLVGDFTAMHLGEENHNCGKVWGHITTGQARVGIERSGPGGSGIIAYDETVTAAAENWLKSAPDNQPWFLTVGWYGPHCTYCCPRDLFDYYMAILPKPDGPDDFADSCHPAIRRWLEIRGILEVDPEAVRRARAAYYGLVELTDRYVGRVIEALESSGRAKNTLIVYASDHGDMIGQHGLWWKSNFYEGSARVPCLFSWPGTVMPGGVLPEPTSLLDLAPTLLAAASAPQLPFLDGVDLNGRLDGSESAPAVRTVFSMLGDTRDDHPSAMIRRGAWKLVAHAGYPDVQLFNLEEDPGEHHDRGRDENCRAIREELRRDLFRRWNPERAELILREVAANGKLIQAWNRVVRPPSDGEFWRADPACNYRD
jgi:choline-sulfatase